MSITEMEHNGSLLIIAGSETTATVLSGVTFLLLTNPHTMRKLEDEIITAFGSDDEINILAVQNLSYINACLDEGLRMYPPTPAGSVRIVPKGGALINGQHVPENVRKFARDS